MEDTCFNFKKMVKIRCEPNKCKNYVLNNPYLVIRSRQFAIKLCSTIATATYIITNGPRVLQTVYIHVTALQLVSSFRCECPIT